MPTCHVSKLTTIGLLLTSLSVAIPAPVVYKEVVVSTTVTVGGGATQAAQANGGQQDSNHGFGYGSRHPQEPNKMQNMNSGRHSYWGNPQWGGNQASNNDWQPSSNNVQQADNSGQTANYNNDNSNNNNNNYQQNQNTNSGQTANTNKYQQNQNTNSGQTANTNNYQQNQNTNSGQTSTGSNQGSNQSGNRGGNSNQGSVVSSAASYQRSPSASSSNSGSSNSGSSNSDSYSDNSSSGSSSSGGSSNAALACSSHDGSYAGSWCTPDSVQYSDSVFKEQVLNATNVWRKEYNAKPLTWDEKLASFGQKQAEQCIWQHTNDKQKGSDPYGENLGQNYNGATAMVDAFGNEAYTEYDWQNPSYCHFSQLVWQSTTKVGCGKAWCGGKNGVMGWLVNCEYDPPGNYAGEFEENVCPKSGCPSGGSSGSSNSYGGGN